MKEYNDITNNISHLYEEAYQELKPRVARIINNHLTDSYLLEITFDSLLTIPTKECFDLFTCLYDYALDIDRELAEDYMQIYNEKYNEKEKVHQL